MKQQIRVERIPVRYPDSPSRSVWRINHIDSNNYTAMSDLPPEYMKLILALDVAGENVNCDGVGMKIGTNIYWIDDIEGNNEIP